MSFSLLFNDMPGNPHFAQAMFGCNLGLSDLVNPGRVAFLRFIVQNHIAHQFLFMRR
jgi:hypothetical protein